MKALAHHTNQTTEKNIRYSNGFSVAKQIILLKLHTKILLLIEYFPLGKIDVDGFSKMKGTEQLRIYKKLRTYEMLLIFSLKPK